MCDQDPLNKLGRKLRRRGLPGGYVSRTLRELAEHREDLRSEARERGLADAAAEQFVTERLGNLEELTTKLSQAMRRSNWYGRHPVLTFCVLPLFAFISAFMFAAWVLITVGELAGWADLRNSLDADGWSGVSFAIHLFRWGLFTAIPFWFCWLARNSYCGYRWAFSTCLIFSLHGLVHASSFTAPIDGGQGSLSWGYSTNLDPIGLLVPLVVFGLFRMLCRYTDAHETAQEKAHA